MKEVNLLIDNYYSWLRDKTSWKNIENWIEITTPYLDRNNDYIQIYLQKIEEHYILTDGGDTITGLLQEGCTINNSTPKRQKLLQTALNGYGVKEKEGRLEITSDEKNFSLRKHSLLQAILAVNDMFYLTKSSVANLFFEDIREWFDQSKIRYSEFVSFNGRSGYSRKFDFLVPKSPNAPGTLDIELIFDSLRISVGKSQTSTPQVIIVDLIDRKFACLLFSLTLISIRTVARSLL